MPSTNETEFYGLSQWVETDPFVRVDFNADNAKLDQELHRVETLAEESRRVLPDIAYVAYNLALRNYYEGKSSGTKRGMFYDGFLNGGIIDSKTGNVVVRDNVLCLDGVGAEGSISVEGISMPRKWDRAICWLRGTSAGDVAITLNGQKMFRRTFDTAKTLQGESCLEYTYGQERPGESMFSMTLALSCGKASSMKVYDYGIVFF